MKILTLEDGIWMQASAENIVTRMSRMKSVANSSDAAVAQALLEEHLPSGVQLISIHIIMPNNHGVINYRVGIEHKQIRF